MLVQPGSSTEICEAAEFLINNPESAKAIGMRGCEVAQSCFDYRKQGRHCSPFSRTYERLLRGAQIIVTAESPRPQRWNILIWW